MTFTLFWASTYLCRQWFSPYIWIQEQVLYPDNGFSLKSTQTIPLLNNIVNNFLFCIFWRIGYWKNSTIFLYQEGHHKPDTVKGADGKHSAFYSVMLYFPHPWLPAYLPLVTLTFVMYFKWLPFSHHIAIHCWTEWSKLHCNRTQQSRGW